MKKAWLRPSNLFVIVATSFAVARAEVHGHWEKTWRTPSTAKKGMNMGIAFSGWSNVQRALNESGPVLRRLQGTRYISIGGGNANGRWSRRTLEDMNRAIRSGQLWQYQGIAYDVEEGDSGLSHDFEGSFRLANSHGFCVLVAVSNSAPYGIMDRKRLMDSFLASRNIDYISPILYSTGNCQLVNHISTDILDVPWTWYNRSRAKIVPSLLHGRVYSKAQSFWGDMGRKPMAIFNGALEFNDEC